MIQVRHPPSFSAKFIIFSAFSFWTLPLLTDGHWDLLCRYLDWKWIIAWFEMVKNCFQLQKNLKNDTTNWFFSKFSNDLKNVSRHCIVGLRLLRGRGAHFVTKHKTYDTLHLKSSTFIKDTWSYEMMTFHFYMRYHIQGLDQQKSLQCIVFIQEMTTVALQLKIARKSYL